MNITVLDGHTVNPGDIDWEPIGVLGSLQVFDRTDPSEIVTRSLDADVLVVNKVEISREELGQLTNLKAIFLLATGYNNIDLKAVKEQGIAVYNAVGYGSESVAQHTISLILEQTNQVGRHHHSVKRGDWSDQNDFSYTLHTVKELKGKTLGLYGFGMIGKRVAELGLAFGMKILVFNRSTRPSPGIHFVDKDVLFRQSDFLSLHVPLSAETAEVINRSSLKQMKEDLILINTGRGGLINERDLAKALVNGRIAGASLDVLSLEPPLASNPILCAPNCIITPHMAWTSLEARSRLIEIVAQNISNFKRGIDLNRVA